MGLFGVAIRISHSAMILAAAMNPEAFSGAQDAITRLRRGDPDALTAMISRYQHRLYRYLLRLVREPAAAAHRRMFDRRDQKFVARLFLVARFDGRRQRQHIGFRPARGEKHIGRLRTHKRRDLLAGVLDHAPGRAAFGMDRRRIAGDRQCLRHGFFCRRAQRRRRVPVEISALGHGQRHEQRYARRPDGAQSAVGPRYR